MSFSTVCQASTTACPTTAIGAVQICKTSDECLTSGDVCNGFSILGMTIQFCQAPKAGADSGTGTDSGTGAETSTTTDAGDGG
jgi:hypothetical protein